MKKTILLLSKKPEVIFQLKGILEPEFSCEILTDATRSLFHLPAFDVVIIDFDNLSDAWLNSVMQKEVPRVLLSTDKKHEKVNVFLKERIFWHLDSLKKSEFLNAISVLADRLGRRSLSLEHNTIQVIKHVVNNSLQISSLSLSSIKKNSGGNSFDEAILKIQKANNRISDLLLTIEAEFLREIEEGSFSNVLTRDPQ